MQPCFSNFSFQENKQTKQRLGQNIKIPVKEKKLNRINVTMKISSFLLFFQKEC